MKYIYAYRLFWREITAFILGIPGVEGRILRHGLFWYGAFSGAQFLYRLFC